MIKCAMHQPHYFPWLGYLNKMASVDKFIILDEAQIEKGSNMYRNKLCTWDGKEKYITIAYEKQRCLQVPFNRLKIDNKINWKDRQINFIVNNYRKCLHFEEIWNRIKSIYEKEYDFIDEVVEESIIFEKEILGISTEIIMQSTIEYDKKLKKNDLLIELCNNVSAKIYLSGNGARKYMDVEMFKRNGIIVEFQKFTYPNYKQMHEFVGNLSALDLLFNCGIDESKQIFWESVNAE